MEKCSNFSEIEGKVPLKRSFQLTGNENIVPVSESPTCPEFNFEKFQIDFY